MKNLLKRLSELVSEANGQWSSIRAQGWVVVLTFIADWVTHIARGAEFTPAVAVVGLIVGILTAKAAQKFAEEKSDTAEPESSVD